MLVNDALPPLVADGEAAPILELPIELVDQINRHLVSVEGMMQVRQHVDGQGQVWVTLYRIYEATEFTHEWTEDGDIEWPVLPPEIPGEIEGFDRIPEPLYDRCLIRFNLRLGVPGKLPACEPSPQPESPALASDGRDGQGPPLQPTRPTSQAPETDQISTAEGSEGLLDRDGDPPSALLLDLSLTAFWQVNRFAFASSTELEAFMQAIGESNVPWLRSVWIGVQGPDFERVLHKLLVLGVGLRLLHLHFDRRTAMKYQRGLAKEPWDRNILERRKLVDLLSKAPRVLNQELSGDSIGLPELRSLLESIPSP